MSRHHQTLKHLRQLGLNSGGCGAGLGNGDCGLGNDNGTGEETVPASLDNGVHKNSANTQENGHNEGSTPLREPDTEIITSVPHIAPINNSDHTAKLKRKLDNENNATRPPSKRNSALSASKKMQDWTSILSKR